MIKVTKSHGKYLNCYLQIFDYFLLFTEVFGKILVHKIGIYVMIK